MKKEEVEALLEESHKLVSRAAGELSLILVSRRGFTRRRAQELSQQLDLVSEHLRKLAASKSEEG